MATQPVSIRVSVDGGSKAKAELIGIGQDGQAALDRLAKATEPASRGLLALDSAGKVAHGTIAGFADRLGAAGAGLAALGPVGLGVAAAFGLIGLSVGKGLTEFSQAEEASLQLQAVLKATGYAAGLTADQIDEMADAIEGSTMQTAETAKAAAAVLLTFKSVQGDQFRQALTLSADLAATFGGDMRSAATQLGKALEDPIEGITALKRVGISFTVSQKELIKGFLDTGEAAKAQQVILDNLAGQPGGSAAGGASGLAGSFKRAADEIGNFFEKLVTVTGIASLAKQALDKIAEGIRGINKEIGGGGTDVDEYAGRIAAAQRTLFELRQNYASDADFEASPAVQSLKKKIEGYQGLQRAAEDAVLAEKKEAEAIAAAGAAKAKAAQEEERYLKLTKDITSTLEQNATQEEKIAKLRTDAAKQLQQLETFRKSDGSNAADIEAQAKRIQEGLARSIAAIGKADSKAAEAASTKSQEVLDDLETAARVFGDAREKFIQGYLDKLGFNAGAEVEAKVRAAADKLYNVRSGEKFTQDNQAAIEKYRKTMEELTRDLEAGTVAQDVFMRASQKAAETLRADTVRQLQESANQIDNIRGAFLAYGKEATDFSKNVGTAISSAMSQTEDYLVAFLTGTEAKLSDLIRAIAADLVRLGVRQGILGPLAGLLGGGFGVGAGAAPVYGGIYHAGGTVGQGGGGRKISIAAYSDAVRMHSGGTVGGLRHDERPIIAQVGERIQSREELLRSRSGPLIGGTTVQVGGDVSAATVQRLEGVLRDHEKRLATMVEYVAAELARRPGLKSPR